MDFKVVFLNTKVEKETLNFPKGILANFIHIVEMIEEFGSALGKPYTAKTEKKLFEIRAKGSEGIGRSFFCTAKENKIVILHSFIKKTKKIPKKEITIARKRLKEFKMKTVSFEDFTKIVLSNSEIKEEYDSLIPAYKFRKKLIRLRKQAGLTQEEVAEILNTKKSNISRLENVNSKISPKISTIENYAKAIGYDIEINFIPLSQQ